MAGDIKTKRVNIYIDQQAAEAAYKRLSAEQEKWTKKIEEGQASGKKMVTELKRLDEVNTSLKKVQDQMDRGLKPSLIQQTQLVSKLRNELKRMSETDKEFTVKVEIFRKQNAELQRMQDNIKGVAAASKGGSLFGQVFNGALLANFASQAISGLKNIATESIQAALEAEGVKRAFNRLNQPDLLDKLRTATRGTVNDLELMKRAVQANNFQIPLEKLGTLLEFAQRRARDTGESVDYLVESIVTGIARKSPLILDNLGINIQRINEEFKSTGDFAKAAFNVVDQELEKAGPALESAADKVDRLKVGWQNFKLSLGEGLVTIADNISGVFERSLTDSAGRAQIFAREANQKILAERENALRFEQKVIADYQEKFASADKEGRDKIIANVQAEVQQIQIAESNAYVKGEVELKKTLSKKLDLWFGFYKNITNPPALAGDTLAGLQSELQLLQTNLQNLSIGSKEFKETQKQIAALQKQINDATGKSAAAAVKSVDAAAQKLKQLKEQAQAFLKQLDDQDFLAQVPNDLQQLALSAKEYFNNIQKLGEELSKGLISQAEFEKAMAQVERIYKDKVRDMSKDPAAKIKLQVEVPKLTEEELPKGDALYHRAGFLTPKEMEEKAKQEQQKREEIAGYVADGLNIVSQALDAIEQQQQRIDARRIANIETANNREKLVYATQLNQKLISNQQYQKKVAELDEKADKQKEEIERKAFARNKRSQIAQAVINGAVGLVKLWASPGFPAAIPLSIALGVQTAAQVAIIAAQKYAQGGKVLSGEKINKKQNVATQSNGDNVLAYVKRGEVILNEQQQQALGGDKTFAAIGVPGFGPQYRNRKYMAIDTAGITGNYTKLRYAGGGIAGAASANGAPDSSVILNAILQQLQQQQTVVVNNAISLKQISDANDQLTRIKQNAILQ